MISRILAAALLCLVGGASSLAAQSPEPLRQHADDMGFVLGSAIAGEKWARDKNYRDTLAYEFNSGQAIVFMKVLQPSEGFFNWRPLDRQADYARENQMRLMGHALIYRADTLPAWAVGLTSPERLEAVMRDYIHAVIGRGGDAFFAWEVVNEPISTRNQPWERAFGREGYIARAFQYAREAAPDAVLILNQSFRREGVDPAMVTEFFELVGNLKAKDVPIDAVGIEMHLEAHKLRRGWLDEFRNFLAMAEAADVLVYITEMDVYQGTSPGVDHPSQEEVYQQTLATCLSAAHCRGLYTWGVSDRYTWLRTRKNNAYPDAAPLLFDDDYQRKPAYFVVQETLREARDIGVTRVRPWR